MEPEGSLPHLQEPSIDPSPEPDQSSPHHTTPHHTTPPHSISPESILILSAPSPHVLVFIAVSFLLAFPPVTYMRFSFPFVLHSLTIS
jgi:hypothetical protein